MPTTLTHAITYPAGNVAPNVPLAMQSQAESTATAIEAQRVAGLAKSAVVTYAASVAAYSAGVHPTATRQGVFVVLNGRVSRTVAGTQVFTIPVGYRPTRTVFAHAMYGNTPYLLQIEPTGVVTTPFYTSTGDLMIQVTFECPVSPAA